MVRGHSNSDSGRHLAHCSVKKRKMAGHGDGGDGRDGLGDGGGHGSDRAGDGELSFSEDRWMERRYRTLRRAFFLLLVITVSFIFTLFLLWVLFSLSLWLKSLCVCVCVRLFTIHLSPVLVMQ